MLVYDKRDGSIISVISKHQDPKICYQFYPTEFIDNIGTLILSQYPMSLNEYKIVDGVLVERSDIEIMEVFKYGRILTDSERYENNLLDKLYPSLTEIQKAENTIEILSLLSEVL